MALLLPSLEEPVDSSALAANPFHNTFSPTQVSSLLLLKPSEQHHGQLA